MSANSSVGSTSLLLSNKTSHPELYGYGRKIDISVDAFQDQYKLKICGIYRNAGSATCPSIKGR